MSSDPILEVQSLLRQIRHARDLLDRVAVSGKEPLKLSSAPEISVILEKMRGVVAGLHLPSQQRAGILDELTDLQARLSSSRGAMQMGLEEIGDGSGFS